MKKNTILLVKYSAFCSGGDYRDRTGDLLHAMQALSRSERLHTPLNRAETALQYTGNLVIAYNS